MESNKTKIDKPKNPRAGANAFSAATFSWTLPLFFEGYKRDLDIEDLSVPLEEHTSNVIGDVLERAWKLELDRCSQKNLKPSLLKVIIRVFGYNLLAYGGVLFVTEIIFRMLQPFFLAGLIAYFTPYIEFSTEKAYLCALGLILATGIIVFSSHPYMMAVMHIGMKVRVAVCSIVYRKALKLSKTALGQTTVGQVVNLLSNDVGRFDTAFMYLHNLWIGPLQTCIVTYFSWHLIGPSSLIGLVSLLMFVPFQAWLGKKASSLRMKTAVRTDERVRLMNEIINAIQVIKMYTWEKPFVYLVSLIRRKEMSVIGKTSYIRGVMLSFMLFHTRASIFCSILAYVLLGNNITAQKVFVVTCFYNTLRQTMTIFFPQGITQVAEVIISIKRIEKFLLYEENTNYLSTSHLEKQKSGGDVTKTMIQAYYAYEKSSYNPISAGIYLTNVSAKWTNEQTENTLSNISMKVVPGKLTAIIGPVGSGKTSLLHVVLKELPLQSGSLNVSGVVSYASQEPWLFGGSVRQNILFGEPFDRDRYQKVVKVCALRTDFKQFPYGDKTIVGERGVSLSGGQRARINLARAVYKKADIYLLDDPLSAVDTHVGKHLFDDCVTGFLQEKTVILITHQLQYLNNVDHIILLENGCIKSEGTVTELQSSGFDFTALFSKNEETDEEESQSMSESTHSRQPSIQSTASSQGGVQTEEPKEVAESRTKGSVTGMIYKSYLMAGGGCILLLLVLFMCIFAQFLASAGDYWITYWVNLEEHVFQIDPNKGKENERSYWLLVSREQCIFIFTGLIVGTIVITVIRSFMFFYMSMKASIRLHNKMFESIIHATMWFFNNNSSGRILNRFSKDMGAIDELLPAALIDCLQIGLTLLAIVLVVMIMNPWLVIPTVIAGIIFYYLRLFYVSTSRSIKRLEGITRSPVFSHLSASLQGLTTIRAFKAQKILEKEFDYHQDLHSSAWYLFIASSRAFGFWLDLVCLVYIAIVTLSFFIPGVDNYGGNVGLAITQSIGLTGMLQWGMRQSAELESQMTSVERVLEYSNLESEPSLESPPDLKPKKSWPDQGKLEFSKVFLRYEASGQWVLKNLNFLIEPQEKIGIVGRTGAGKSSLISALFRLSEIQGFITIDGISTAPIGLHDLRSKISIIPQEPVLFSGSMRKNLDPFEQYPDDVLWNALEEVELKEVVSELQGGLDAKISEGGTNMSVGQRQLVCLARAIIRNNKILVMDEATANVDPKTDALIQTTIRKKFALCTVLTIAHRLNTVMDSDRVLVMDAGNVMEFDHPHILLQNEDGYLFGMVEKTGKATAEILHNVAAENYQELLRRTSQDLQ